MEASVWTTATASTVTEVSLRSYLQIHVDTLGGSSSQVERLVLGLLKARRVHGEFVVSDLDIDKLIRAVRSVIVERSALVPVFIRVTFAIGTKLPEGSFTVPSTVPKVDWP